MASEDSEERGRPGRAAPNRPPGPASGSTTGGNRTTYETRYLTATLVALAALVVVTAKALLRLTM